MKFFTSSFSFSSTEVVFFLVFFQFSILSTIDNAPREYLIENKTRFSLFFVFTINISVISVKAGIISENIRCEISANVFFTDSVFESMLLFFLLGK